MYSLTDKIQMFGCIIGVQKDLLSQVSSAFYDWLGVFHHVFLLVYGLIKRNDFIFLYIQYLIPRKLITKKVDHQYRICKNLSQWSPLRERATQPYSLRRSLQNVTRPFPPSVGKYLISYFLHEMAEIFPLEDRTRLFNQSGQAIHHWLLSLR